MHGLEHWQELGEVWIYRGMAVWCLEGGRGEIFQLECNLYIPRE